MKLKKTTCSDCGKTIYRYRVHPHRLCQLCWNEYRKRRYRGRFKTDFRNHYPVLQKPGTSAPTTNLKIIRVNGKQRVKGAVWLQQQRKNNKNLLLN